MALSCRAAVAATAAVAVLTACSAQEPQRASPSRPAPAEQGSTPLPPERAARLLRLVENPLVYSSIEPEGDETRQKAGLTRLWSLAAQDVELRATAQYRESPQVLPVAAAFRDIAACLAELPEDSRGPIQELCILEWERWRVALARVRPLLSRIAGTASPAP